MNQISEAVADNARQPSRPEESHPSRLCEARRIELWQDALVVPPALAAGAAVLAFGNELLDICRSGRWRTPDGRTFAAAKLLPLAEAALLLELQRPDDTVKTARTASPAREPARLRGATSSRCVARDGTAARRRRAARRAARRGG
jgi:hypothetical protein